MEFDGTTFALEIINFLVLVWLLQRVLYKPVTNAIAARKDAIEKTLSGAQLVRTEAETLRQQFEHRMADWEQEKAQARLRLENEIEAERGRMMSALQVSLDEVRDKTIALEQRRAAEQRRRLEAQATAEGGQFVARLLSRLASAELEERIRKLLLEDLPQLAEAELQVLRAASQEKGADIASAYPLGDAERASLVEALSRLAGRPVACEFKSAPDLIAGLRIGIGPWMLRASLLDELQFFGEAQRADFKH